MKRDDGKQITKVSLLFQVTFLFHFWFLNKDPEALLKYVEDQFELNVGVYEKGYQGMKGSFFHFLFLRKV